MQTRPKCATEPPVFVFGALRSGTTVFRLMLNAHPELSNPGEVDFLFDFLQKDAQHPSGWRYDLDGLKTNRGFRSSGLELSDGLAGLDLLQDFMDQYRNRHAGPLTLNIHRHIGKALNALPDAHVIHMLRDPRDVARSSIGMGWAGTLYHGVNHWIETEEEWDNAAKDLVPGQHIGLTYEDLIRDAEGELRKVCNFLGVRFFPDMLRYHENSTYSAPDPSLIEQWKRKSSAYEIALVEGKAEALARARGYALSGAPRHPGVMERARLRFLNRTRIWNTAVRRYGLPLFVIEKVTRRLKLVALHRQCLERMRDRDAAILK